jgi:tape measure domain-containing protein
MATYQSEIVYVARGVDGSTGKVINLADAIKRLETRNAGLRQSGQQAAVGVSAMDRAVGSALQRLSGSNASIDPMRFGLAGLVSDFVKTGKAANATERAIEGAGSQAKAQTISMNALALGIGAISVVTLSYAGDVIRLADAYTSLQGRIKIYTKDAAEAAMVEDALFKAARDTRQAVEPMVALYARLAPVFQETGRSQQDVIRFTTLVAKSLATQGATTREVEASTIQLAQALASGVLRGDEFKSLMEASPALMRRVAEGMGVPTSALRAMAEEGKLTASAVIAAVEKMSGKIESDFTKAPKTVAQGWQVLNDAVMRAVGTEVTASGAQAKLANALLAVADAADDVVRTILQVGEVAVLLGSAYLAGQAMAAVTALRLLKGEVLVNAAAMLLLGPAANAGTASLTGTAIASNVATAALTRLRAIAGTVVAFLGGPWGAAVAATVVGLALFRQHQDSLNVATKEYQGVATQAKTAAEAYASATMAAATASGVARESALKEAAALREVAVQARSAAQEKLSAARATVAQLIADNQRAIENDRYRGAAGGDRPGTILPTINAGRIQKQNANALAAQAAIDDATKKIAEGDRVLNAPVRSLAPPAGDTKETPAQRAARLAAARSARQGVQGLQATARASQAEANAEENANRRLALSLEAVGDWRTAARAAAELQYKDNPGAKAQALAAIEVQATAKRTEAQNRYETAVDRAAKSDAANANRSEAAAKRVQARREREIALVQQYQASAEQAAAQSRAVEESDLSTKLEVLETQRDAEKVSARLRIVNLEREREALAAIDREYDAKAVTARQAYADKILNINREAAQAHNRIFDEALRANESRANNQGQLALSKASDAITAGNDAGARYWLKLWRDALQEAEEARERMDAAEIVRIGANAVQRIEAKKRELGATAEFARAETDIENNAQAEISNIRTAAKDRQDRAAQEQLQKQIEIIREQQREWYSAGERSAEAFKSAVLAGDFSGFGKTIAQTILEAAYDGLVGDPIRAGIKSILDNIFRVPKQQSERDMGQAAKLAAGTLNAFAGTVDQRAGGGSGNLASSAATAVTGSGWLSKAFGAVRNFFKFADGGIMGPNGPVNLKAYSKGGIANSPQLALYGEGRTPEAYVPLPDGRSIPVTMRAPFMDMQGGGASGGRGATIVNVTHIRNIDAQGADAAALARVESKLDQMDEGLERRTVAIVSEAIYNRQVA